MTLCRRDAATGEHTGDVARMAEWVADELELPPLLRAELREVALLHDLAIPDAILQKPGPLTADEWEVVHRHPTIGARMVCATGALAHLAAGIRAHHERWDGSGYPDGLAGRQIPLISRIVSVCDAFEAMTSDRPYRPALRTDEALSELEAAAGSQLDPQIVDVVLQRFATTRRQTMHVA
jgi:two-component system cell cycle response regulator